MKNVAISIILLLGGFSLMCGCNTSHVLVGAKRTPTDPAHIKVYFTVPKRYEPIAVISSDSGGTFFTFGAQGKIDAALGRAKRDAAKLGANGLLLQSLGETGSVTVGHSVSSGSGASYFGVTSSGIDRTVSVLAIYVLEE